MKRQKKQRTAPKFSRIGVGSALATTAPFLMFGVLALSFFQLIFLDSGYNIDKNGDFTANFGGFSFLPVLLNNFDPSTVFGVLVAFFLVFGIMTTLCAMVSDSYGDSLLIPSAVMLVSIGLALFGAFTSGFMGVDDSGKIDAYVAHEKLKADNVQVGYADYGDALALSSLLDSESSVTDPDKDEVSQLMMVQNKDGMSVYSVAGDIRNVDDFTLLGEVEKGKLAQAKSLFNSMENDD